MKSSILLAVLSLSASAQTSPRAAARLLDQATFGPTPSSVAALESSTITGWLNAQFALNTSDLPDQPMLNSDGKNNTTLAPVKSAFFQNAVSGQDQLRQRVAFALSQIWVVSADVRRFVRLCLSSLLAHISRQRFRQLPRHHSGSHAQPGHGPLSQHGQQQQGQPCEEHRAPTKITARELMQLVHARAHPAEPERHAVLDRTATRCRPTTEAIMTDMAKVLTGWTYPTAPGATAKTNNPEYYIGQMFAVMRSMTTPRSDLRQHHHPGRRHRERGSHRTARRAHEPAHHGAVCQPATDSTSGHQQPQPGLYPAYLAGFREQWQRRVRRPKAVITAILTDPEARAADDPTAAPNPNFGHLREPILFMANILRGLNGGSVPRTAVNSYTANMGEDLFYAPSVFSYFSPQYRTEGGLLGPEFQIYSTQTVADRADIVNSVLYGKLDSTTTVDLTPFVSQAGNTADCLTTSASVFLHGAMSAALTRPSPPRSTHRPRPPQSAGRALRCSYVG